MKMRNLMSGVVFLMLIFSISCGNNDDEIEKTVLVNSISVIGNHIVDGQSSQMTTIILPLTATNQEVEWSVSDETIAFISPTGLVTAIKNGKVTVTASALDESGKSGTKSLSISGVTGPPVPVASLTIEGENIIDGGSSQLSVAILPANASNKSVTWSVSDENIATISTSGLLKAVKNGNVTVTANANDNSGKSASKEFTISGKTEGPVLVENITVTGSNITDGNPTQLSITFLPSNATDPSVNWSVSNANIAIISDQGLLTPLNNGSVTVTAATKDGSDKSGQLLVNISGVSNSIEGTIVSTKEEILAAISNAAAGEKIYVRGGTYVFSTTIGMSKKGTSGNMISLLAYPLDPDRPKFDFSSMSESSGNRGLSLSGDYWHIKGIDVFAAGDNGLNISGDNNLVEFCTFSENADTGLQLGGGATNNTILNCDSYYNADATVENADGFACKLDAGTGNKFIGCRAWQNLDDGWDGYLRGTDNITTTYENCWAFKNGILKNGSAGGGDGNGFKTGGSDTKDLKHNAIYKNCIAAGNLVDGFDHNSNRGDVIMYNCASHNNGHNINFSNSNIANSLTLKNSFILGGGSSSFNATITDITNNGWQDNIVTDNADFLSVDIELLLTPRNEDGSLPSIDYLHLVSGSDLIDKGVNVGLSFKGSAPDIGVFER